MRRLLLALLFLVSSTLEGADFRPQQVVRPFDPITEPEIAEIGDAAKWVKADELVLGVVVEGEARAYSINQLTSPTREIINDSLGGRYIAATW